MINSFLLLVLKFELNIFNERLGMIFVNSVFQNNKIEISFIQYILSIIHSSFISFYY